jgi:3-oxoacyl-[acyl-carrier-protein] synthase-3
MSDQVVDIGIAGLGYAFGADVDVAQAAGSYVQDPERVARWGIHTFHRAADDVAATDLAAAAAGEVLAGLGMTADELDLVALATSEMPDYLYWDTSAALARELKIEKVQTLLLNEGCATGVTGLGTVAGLFAVQPELRTALFVAVNRVSEHHRNRMNVNNAVHSDGAAAVVLRRGHEHVRWLATEQFTDPDLCDFFRLEHGGAVAPQPPADWSSATAPSALERVLAHFDRDPRRLEAFRAQLAARVVEAIEGACRRAGRRLDEVAHLIYINDSPEAIEDIGRACGVPVERTNARLAATHGHMGGADQLTCLAQHLERGEVQPGDLVALSGISSGMRWYCSLVQI